MYTDWDGYTTHYGGSTTPWNTSAATLQMAEINVDYNDGLKINVFSASIYDYINDTNYVRSAVTQDLSTDEIK